MLEQSFGLNFYLKTPENESKIRFVYVRVTVDGVPKDKSTKRKWDVSRWDQKAERAIGTKEDARVLNYFLDSLTTKINQYKTDLLNQNITITSQLIADYVGGNTVSKAKVLEEFQTHNDELAALVKKANAPKAHMKGMLPPGLTFMNLFGSSMGRMILSSASLIMNLCRAMIFT
ncbi:Arm DNA-binding domain-containing protein [Niabella sp. W65]|nr:Arm DNA-binding domain-containing protein [Niabella sp. W65]MCH7364101.1 Arm DNA-binding domain-containing protein [Niabella sp. W65]ULT39978.1 Arm DNA-binding domain-containing protein [Niabella sp. I65]